MNDWSDDEVSKTKTYWLLEDSITTPWWSLEVDVAVHMSFVDTLSVDTYRRGKTRPAAHRWR